MFSQKKDNLNQAYETFVYHANICLAKKYVHLESLFRMLKIFSVLYC